MKIDKNPTSETITKFFKQHPEYIRIIENKFKDNYQILPTDDNYWMSEELTKKSFYNYYGINEFPKKPTAAIAEELKISSRAVENKVQRVIEFLQDATKSKKTKE